MIFKVCPLSCNLCPLRIHCLLGVLGQLVICIWVLAQVGGNQKYTVKVSHDALPEAIIGRCIFCSSGTLKYDITIVDLNRESVLSGVHYEEKKVSFSNPIYF